MLDAIDISQFGGSPLDRDNQAAHGFDDIEPLDIFAEADRPAPVWNPGHYPPIIARYAEDIAKRTGADPAIPCWTALSIAGAAIPDWVKIQVKANDPSWTEAARLWVMIVGLPSIKKTPPMAEVRACVDALQAEWASEYGKRKARFDLDLDVYKQQRRAYVKSPEEHPVPVPPEEPHLRRLIFTDSTIEAVARLLEHNPQGLLSFHDELSGWFGSMDAYRGKGVNKDRPDWLKLFNGGPHLVDRAGGHRSIPNWSAGILGGIQPDLIRSIAASLKDDGLMQRFLPIIANDAGPDRDVPANSAWSGLFESMVRGFSAIMGGRTHRLVPAAQGLLTEARHEVQLRGKMPIYDTRLRTAYQKGEGILARLVLLFHYLEEKTGEIGQDTVRRAVGLYKHYLAPSLVHFYGQTLRLSEGTEDARWIAGYILAREVAVIDARTVKRAYKALRKAENADISMVMDDLFLAGWVEPVDTRIGRVPHRWTVNPVVHERFRERAGAERAHREMMRQKIQDEVNK